ncbi:M15 family metallopeptidase [Knoellia locipacati]|uniref:M15 family metallopeptidase n=1 Tax=Knoellia locipacati TaxID=882824 RepID=UPI00384E71B5
MVGSKDHDLQETHPCACVTSPLRPGMLIDGDDAVTSFTSRGFDWGGHWTSLRDYQHREIRQP